MIFTLSLLALSNVAAAVSSPLSIDAPRARSVEVCIADYEAKLKKGDVALGISVPEATRLTHEIVTEVGASNQPTVARAGQSRTPNRLLNPRTGNGQTE